MDIIRYYLHKGSLDEIATQYEAFSKLKNARIKSPWFRWQDITSGSISNHAIVVFLGKTGYGKSSTVNALFGGKLMETDDVRACTRECQSLDFELSPNCFFSLADLPGVGESETNDIEYLKMYKEIIKYSIGIVYVIRADMRDYTLDVSVCNEFFTNKSSREKVVLALNFCDKIEPIDRSPSGKPSPLQLENIKKKIKCVKDVFQPITRVIPYSAQTGWNMNELAEEIVQVVCKSDEVITKE